MNLRVKKMKVKIFTCAPQKQNSTQVRIMTRNRQTETNFSPKHYSLAAGREKTVKSPVLLNPFFVTLWILPLNHGFLTVRKRRISRFY